MTDLAKRLLSSLENHGRSSVEGVYKLHPHERSEDVMSALIELEGLGWIKISYQTIQTGPSAKETKPKNVWRTKKTMYKEQMLF